MSALGCWARTVLTSPSKPPMGCARENSRGRSARRVAVFCVVSVIGGLPVAILRGLGSADGAGLRDRSLLPAALLLDLGFALAQVHVERRGEEDRGVRAD